MAIGGWWWLGLWLVSWFCPSRWPVCHSIHLRHHAEWYVIAYIQISLFFCCGDITCLEVEWLTPQVLIIISFVLKNYNDELHAKRLMISLPECTSLTTRTPSAPIFVKIYFYLTKQYEVRRKNWGMNQNLWNGTKLVVLCEYSFYKEGRKSDDL